MTASSFRTNQTLALVFALLALPACLSQVTEDKKRYPSEQLATAAFDQIKRHAGAWSANSTKGWEGDYVISVLARGSTVLYTSEFRDVKGSGMATAVFLDQGVLKLTHYCEARNQPTLAATSISPDGKEITFEFISGTGMTSRAKGHMDKVIFQFTDDDRFTERWTWYQNGKEQWLEQINYSRKRSAQQPGI